MRRVVVSALIVAVVGVTATTATAAAPRLILVDQPTQLRILRRHGVRVRVDS